MKEEAPRPRTKCTNCGRLVDYGYPCVCQMSPLELMDELATFESGIETHAAFRELRARMGAEAALNFTDAEASEDGEPADHLILCIRQPAMGGYALWWRPNSHGYCAELENAGRYTEADRICRGLSDHSIPVPLSEAEAHAQTVVPQHKVWKR